MKMKNIDFEMIGMAIVVCLMFVCLGVSIGWLIWG